VTVSLGTGGDAGTVSLYTGATGTLTHALLDVSAYII
jgi:hypothetical protein